MANLIAKLIILQLELISTNYVFVDLLLLLFLLFADLLSTSEVVKVIVYVYLVRDYY